MFTFNDAIVEVCREMCNPPIVEVGGNNRGPEVNSILGAVGLPPGEPWCAACAYVAARRAAYRALTSNPCPKTGSGIRMWLLCAKVCRATNPSPGFLYILDHGHGESHVGYVLTLDILGNVDESFSGNTFATGGRAGDRTFIHHGQPEVVHGGTLLGYLDLSRAATQDVA